jgi:hypothetical protein
MSDEAEKDSGRSRSGTGMRILATLFMVVSCGCGCGIVGAFVGISVCCSRWPDSNLAGLVGIFYGLPIGFAVGSCLAGITYPLWRTLFDS